MIGYRSKLDLGFLSQRVQGSLLEVLDGKPFDAPHKTSVLEEAVVEVTEQLRWFEERRTEWLRQRVILQRIIDGQAVADGEVSGALAFWRLMVSELYGRNAGRGGL